VESAAQDGGPQHAHAAFAPIKGAFDETKADKDDDSETEKEN
jgi:hypothetical protein